MALPVSLFSKATFAPICSSNCSSADLVIADISIHNANVFYELGIRHALRDKRTFLIKSKEDKAKESESKETEVPFDLKTDRYLAYDPK